MHITTYSNQQMCFALWLVISIWHLVAYNRCLLSSIYWGSIVRIGKAMHSFNLHVKTYPWDESDSMCPKLTTHNKMMHIMGWKRILYWHHYTLTAIKSALHSCTNTQGRTQCMQVLCSFNWHSTIKWVFDGLPACLEDFWLWSGPQGSDMLALYSEQRTLPFLVLLEIC